MRQPRNGGHSHTVATRKKAPEKRFQIPVCNPHRARENAPTATPKATAGHSVNSSGDPSTIEYWSLKDEDLLPRGEALGSDAPEDTNFRVEVRKNGQVFRASTDIMFDRHPLWTKRREAVDLVLEGLGGGDVVRHMKYWLVFFARHRVEMEQVENEERRHARDFKRLKKVLNKGLIRRVPERYRGDLRRWVVEQTPLFAELGAKGRPEGMTARMIGCFAATIQAWTKMDADDLADVVEQLCRTFFNLDLESGRERIRDFFRRHPCYSSPPSLREMVRSPSRA